MKTGCYGYDVDVYNIGMIMQEISGVNLKKSQAFDDLIPRCQLDPGKGQPTIDQLVDELQVSVITRSIFVLSLLCDAIVARWLADFIGYCFLV